MLQSSQSKLYDWQKGYLSYPHHTNPSIQLNYHFVQVWLSARLGREDPASSLASSSSLLKHCTTILDTILFQPDELLTRTDVVSWTNFTTAIVYIARTCAAASVEDPNCAKRALNHYCTIFIKRASSLETSAPALFTWLTKILCRLLDWSDSHQAAHRRPAFEAVKDLTMQRDSTRRGILDGEPATGTNAHENRQSAKWVAGENENLSTASTVLPSTDTDWILRKIGNDISDLEPLMDDSFWNDFVVNWPNIPSANLLQIKMLLGS